MIMRPATARLASLARTMREEAQGHLRGNRTLEAAALEHYAIMLDEIREQLVQTGMAPEGWRLVPRDPTPGMIVALYSQVRDEECYRQMLQEAPAPGGAS